MKKKNIIIIILGSIFILLSIFHSNIWFDEAYSVGIANQSFIDIWKIGGHDVHPVLYYWMLRCICVLTNGSIIAYRVFSAVAIIILGILGYTHIRKDFGEKTGFLFSFFTYFLPMMAVYANQIRMYSWAILIVTILAIYAYRIYKGDNCKKNWIIFVLTSLSSIYIHYYGLMAAGIINLFLFIYFIKNKKVRRRKRRRYRRGVPLYNARKPALRASYSIIYPTPKRVPIKPCSPAASSFLRSRFTLTVSVFSSTKQSVLQSRSISFSRLTGRLRFSIRHKRMRYSFLESSTRAPFTKSAFESVSSIASP